MYTPAWFQTVDPWWIDLIVKPYALALGVSVLWLVSLVGLVGVFTGVLEAIATVYGEPSGLISRRASIGVGMLLVALAAPVGVLAVQVGGAPGVVLLLAVVLTVAVPYRVVAIRPLAFACAIAWFVGGSAEALVRLVQMLGLGGPSWLPLASAVVIGLLAGIGAGAYGWLRIREPHRRNTAVALTKAAEDVRRRVESFLSLWWRRLLKPTVFVVCAVGVAGMVASARGWAAPWIGWVLAVVLAITPVLIALAVLVRVALWLAVCGVRILRTGGGVSRRVRGGTERMLTPALTLIRFPEALCDTCLRWSPPLKSHYALGVRTCEKCGGTISYPGGRGRLVALLESTDNAVSLPPRVFVRRAEDIARSASPLDVTHVRIPSGLTDTQEFEQLIVYLRNNMPTHGLKSVQVFAEGGSGSVSRIVANWVTSTLSWADSDPLAP